METPVCPRRQTDLRQFVRTLPCACEAAGDRVLPSIFLRPVLDSWLRDAPDRDHGLSLVLLRYLFISFFVGCKILSVNFITSSPLRCCPIHHLLCAYFNREPNTPPIFLQTILTCTSPSPSTHWHRL